VGLGRAALEHHHGLPKDEKSTCLTGKVETFETATSTLMALSNQAIENNCANPIKKTLHLLALHSCNVSQQ
jgi:hypothetical protein